jgi:tRNA-Thr(GGU) m(6)t(6)A37 methyltransferase TsaA
MRLKQIGVVHSRYKERGDAPHQGGNLKEESTLEVFEEFEPGLLLIDKRTRLWVLYWQDRGDRDRLQTTTPWSSNLHGVFSTRSPNRPNPIGLCLVDPVSRKGRFLTVTGLDALDGSPIIDIKPYITLDEK